MRIGDQVVGIVAATAGGSVAGTAGVAGGGRGGHVGHGAHQGGAGGPDSGEALVAELAAGPRTTCPGLLARARRLGVDLSGRGASRSARRAVDCTGLAAGHTAERPRWWPRSEPGRLVAVCAAGGA